MIYPSFLKKNDLVGITALSSGCSDSLDELEVSVNNLRKDYEVILTDDVYGDSVVSGSKDVRANEFNKLLDSDVKMIYIARGGDYLIETIPLIDFDKIKENPVWVQGYSDPTSLLYILTTKYDVASIYGLNGKGYDSLSLDTYQLNNLEFGKGNLIKQESFMDRNTISLNGEFTSDGIIIGGCIDVLKDIVNGEYDRTLDFINRYSNKKIIWYFDIYSLNSRELLDVLQEMKNASWFINSDTFLFGSVMFPSEDGLCYNDSIKQALGNDVNIVVDANIGHIKPSFTIINGSLASVYFKDNKLILEQSLLKETYAVSACLMGDNCKYSGGNNYSQEIFDYLSDKEYVKICPECLGGLSTPRSPSEIVGDRVINKDGIDVTYEYNLGAKKVLEIMKKNNATVAILKSNSPSCGCGQVYDGTFSKKLIDGDGVTTKLLKENGIKVISSDEF